MLLGVVSLTAIGCGGEPAGPRPSTDDFSPPLTAPANAESGGQLVVLASGDVDSVDPGTTYYQFGFMVSAVTQRQLLAWQPDDITEPSPDLAAREPVVSDDGLEITFSLRGDVHYSAPVDRAVVCDDFAYAIERALLPGVANGYVATYLSDLRGFAAAQRAVAVDPTAAPKISGIECPDDQTLVLRLARTSSVGVLGALSLPLGAPVPREYASRYDADSPSTYGLHQVATGPYRIAGDPTAEQLTGYRPGKEIELERNPNWDADTDWRPAYADSIIVREGFADVGSTARKILAGEANVNGDFSLDPSSLERAATEYPDQLALTPTGGVRYIPFDTTQPPFDDVNVRRAVLAAADRVELRNTIGGELAGPVASHFLPPHIPGFEQAGGYGDPYLDFLADPHGDSELAAEYMHEAGFDSGKCEGECEVTMVADSSSPGAETAEVFADQLEQLGFEVELRKVARDVMYTKFCTVPANQPDVCPNLGWLKDFQDPQGMLQASFGGESIYPANNPNWPQLDDPQINEAIADAVYVDDPAQRADAWANVDGLISFQAPALPWVWSDQSNIRSADVAGVVNHFLASWDLSFTSLR